MYIHAHIKKVKIEVCSDPKNIRSVLEGSQTAEREKKEQQQ